MSKRSWKILPKSKPGRWSVGLIVVMPILFGIGSSFTNSLYESVSAGRTIAADITARPLLALTMLTGMGCGIAGFISGLVAIAKQKEKAILVYISTVIGGLLTIYLVADLMFPH